MISSASQKIVVVVIVLLIMGFLGYRLIYNSPDISNLDSISSNEIIGQDILALVEKLRITSIDSSLFSSPLFTNLKDFGADLFPEAYGRGDPFAAFGVEVPFEAPVFPSTGKNPTSGEL